MNERLSPELLAYHLRVLAQLQAAQTVVESWSAYLTAALELRPGDFVDAAGYVQRHAPDHQPQA